MKTTSGDESIHQVSGVSQVEVGHSVGHGFESNLFIVSFGVVWWEGNDEESLTIARIFAEIGEKIEDVLGENAPVEIEYLRESIIQYGAAHGIDLGPEKWEQGLFTKKKFRIKFVRSYDMTDPGIQVLRTPDLVSKVDVIQESVSFTIHLPLEVNGVLNPVKHLSPVVEQMLSLWH